VGDKLSLADNRKSRARELDDPDPLYVAVEQIETHIYGYKSNLAETKVMTMYCPGEGCFKYTGKPMSKYSRRKDGMDSRVAKYRLYHLIEDDWLTYYATRIGANLIGKA
jgi:hypothetical protein